MHIPFHNCFLRTQQRADQEKYVFIDVGREAMLTEYELL